MTTLASYLARKRTERGFSTQSALAKAAGVDREVVNRIERGKTLMPEATVRRRLAQALRISHLDLLVAAGEIQQDEIEAAGAKGRIEISPDDPVELLVRRIKQTDFEGTDIQTLNSILDAYDYRNRKAREGKQ